MNEAPTSIFNFPLEIFPVLEKGLINGLVCGLYEFLKIFSQAVTLVEGFHTKTKNTRTKDSSKSTFFNFLQEKHVITF